MDPSLHAESEKLARSWNQHESAWLRDYLVRQVEDPRINLQSIFTRHFLIRELRGDRFSSLMEQECRFSVCMNWLLRLCSQGFDPEELNAILYALKRGVDNIEGILIPRFALDTFRALPLMADGPRIPNYLESFLANTPTAAGAFGEHPALDTFARAWKQALIPPSIIPAGASPPVLEPACGSANDYRFLDQFGLAPWIDYTGMDLSEKNIRNAREQFPGIRFETGNVFEIAAADVSFEFCFFHDLLEHLSPLGLLTAIREICRVTRRGICAGFFSMNEMPEHVVRPVEEYHWNTLSAERIRDAFAAHHFASRVVHIGTFLRQQFGCEETHNPNAYTFYLWRTEPHTEMLR